MVEATTQLSQRVRTLEQQVGQLLALAGRLLTQSISSNVDPVSFFNADSPLVLLLNGNDHAGSGGDLRVLATWTAQDPVVGSISWKGATVTFQNNTYPITDGSTGTTNFWVFWDVANPNMFGVSANLPALYNPGQFIIAANANIGGSGNVAIVNYVSTTTGADTKIAIQSGAELSVYNSHASATTANLCGRIRPSASITPANVYSGIFELCDGTGTGSLGGGVTIQMSGSSTTAPVQIFNLPSVAPAAGSKGLWYDPADANSVKFVP